MIVQVQDFVVTFSSILWEALPFIVLGAVVAGILEELLPQQAITRIMPKYAIPAVAVGGLLGLVFPMCECGIVVVMRRLLRKGLPLSCCVSYMLAGPIVNGIVLFSTYVAFNGLKTLPNGSSDPNAVSAALSAVGVRAGMGFIVACVAGLAVHVLQKRSNAKLLTALAAPDEPKPRAISLGMAGAAPAAPEPAAPRPGAWKRLSNISETALHDFIDITVFLIIGAVLAALAKLFIIENGIDVQKFAQEQPLLAIPAMMILAVLMCLCSEADAFVAASFTDMPMAPKMAFLVLGPMFDLKLLMMYTRVFRPRLIATIVTCVVAQVLVYSMILQAVHPHPTFDPKYTRPASAAPVAVVAAK